MKSLHSLVHDHACLSFLFFVFAIVLWLLLLTGKRTWEAIYALVPTTIKPGVKNELRS
jgi:hypothetical protein